MINRIYTVLVNGYNLMINTALELELKLLFVVVLMGMYIYLPSVSHSEYCMQAVSLINDKKRQEVSRTDKKRQEVIKSDKNSKKSDKNNKIVTEY